MYIILLSVRAVIIIFELLLLLLLIAQQNDNILICPSDCIEIPDFNPFTMNSSYMNKLNSNILTKKKIGTKNS